jgi:hypothetical protein
MILYVNGDSNSAGTDLTDISRSWPHILSRQLDCDLINHASPGASNAKISRTLQEFINQYTGDVNDIFFIVGWTSWEREEWIYNGQFFSVNAGEKINLTPELNNRYKQWVTEQNFETMCSKSKYWHDEIYKWHTWFLTNNIRHLFFNSVMSFQYEVVPSDQFHVAWEENFLEPYDSDYSYYHYLKNHGYPQTKYCHFLEPAQEVWAKVLHKFIKDKQIL